MPKLPTDALPAAEFLVRHLYRPIEVAAGRRHFAIAETEHPFAGDTWFWTDDNAKAVEFLARPEIARRFAPETDEIVRFLRLMCRGKLIFRRVGMPRLLLTARKGSEESYYHSLMHLRCDLPRGAVMAGIRFHDERTADNLLLHTNCVEFTHRGRPYTLPVEAAIDEADSALAGHRLELRFAGDLRFTPRRREKRVGRISYLYAIDARSMVIDVEARLDVDPAADIADVVLTVGHDHLSHGNNGVDYGSVFVARPGGEPLHFAAEVAGRQTIAATGAPYYSIVQSEIAGFALAVHSAPREPGRLAAIETLVREAGHLHFARARYRFPGPARGARLVAAEHKMLTAGGFYRRVDDCARLLHEAAARGTACDSVVDFSLSYDYGAELNAFARYFVGLAERDGGAALCEGAKALFDGGLDAYFELFVAGHHRRENTIFSRQLAFVVLALTVMYRATGSALYRSRLTQLCDLLLEFEKRFDDIGGAPASGFLMGARSHRFVFVDCHSAALLALTEAARHIDDPRLAEAVDRGLGCYCLDTARIDWHDGPHKADVIGVAWVDDAGARQRNSAFWNYHAGLTLRFFAALRRAADPGLQAAAARHRDRIQLFEWILRRQLARSLTWRDGAVEIRCSTLSGETNSETQPWAAIGLLDRAAEEAG